MRPKRIPQALLMPAGLVLLAAVLLAVPARADMTIHARHQFANGDTATRANYFGKTRMRVTMSDGTEAIYDSKTKELTFLNHARKRFWKGPIDRANAIVDSLTMERDKSFWEAAQEKQQEWFAFTEKFNNSIQSAPVGKDRKIAGKKCVGWEITAGRSMKHTRWSAPEFEVPDFVEQVEKIALLPALDPVGRAIGKLILQAKSKEKGVTMAASTELNTPTQKANFSWEAFRLSQAPIPDSAWEIPEGYEEIKF